MSVNISEIIKFWGKFKQESDNIYNNYAEDSNICLLIDDMIKILGDYSWEIGPSITNDNKLSFVISPNLSSKKLKETEYIISLSPKISKWEFNSAIPPKVDWDLKFKYNSTQLGIPILIDGIKWEYKLNSLGNDFLYDIILYPPFDLKILSDFELEEISEILVEGVLGELIVITKIKKINISFGEHNDTESLSSLSCGLL